MYGNTQFGADVDEVELTAEQRQELRQHLAGVTDRMRELLPQEFVVGSEVTDGSGGPQATIAVQPPLGSVVSANYVPEGDGLEFTEEECDDLVHSLAASAALQVKQALGDDDAAVAQ